MMEITMKSVDSSQIKSVGYDKETQQLYIEFKNGNVYRYSNVPEEFHNQFMKSKSMGIFFNQNIKFGFTYMKLKVLVADNVLQVEN